MNQFTRWFLLLLFSATLFIFSACNGGALEKPTGSTTDPVENALEWNAGELMEERANESTKLDAEPEEESKGENTSVEEKTVELKEVGQQEKTPGATKTETKKTKEVATSTNNSSNVNKTVKQTSENKQAAPKRTKHEAVQKTDATKKETANNQQKKAAKPAEVEEQTKNSEKPKKDTVTVMIKISSNEVPLSPTVVEIEPGDTVLDVFYRVTRTYKIQQSVRGSGTNAYIEGIANVYEFDRGSGSGWMYRVNGIFPDRGVGAVPVQNGDRIDFLYTLNLGKDLNADLQPFRR